jgi:hypothetical protein
VATDMQTMFLSTLRPEIEKANALVDKIQAASGDQTTLVHDIRNNPDTADEKVRKFQEWLAKIDEQREQNVKQIDEYIKANLLPAKDDSFDVEAAKAEFAELRKNINAGKAFGKTPTVGLTDEDFATLPDLKNLRGGSSSTSENGTPTKRPRVSDIKVDGERVFGLKKNDDGTTTEVVNFTHLGTYLTKEAGVTVKGSDIREAIEQAFEVTDLADAKGKSTTISHEVNGKTFSIEVTV